MAQLVISIDPRPTQLNRSISAADTTLQVISTAGFASEGVLSLGQQEIVEYTGITSNTFTGVTRGQYDTDARSFNLGTLVYPAQWVATEAETAERNYTIQYLDDGSPISSKGGIQYVNFTGEGVTASSPSAGNLTVNISSEGGSGLTQPQVMARTLGC